MSHLPSVTQLVNGRARTPPSLSDSRLHALVATMLYCLLGSALMELTANETELSRELYS